MIDGIMVNKGRPPASLGAKSLSEHAHHFIEFVARQVAIRVGGPQQVKQLFLPPLLACGACEEWREENIIRLSRHLNMVQQNVTYTACEEWREGRLIEL